MKHKWNKAAFGICLSVGLLGVFLFLWTAAAEGEAHYTPDYPMENLQAYLEKEELTEEEYTLLLRQTGLGKPAVDELRKRGETDKIKELQQALFREVELCCTPNTIISKEELLLCTPENSPVRIPVVEEGDILITFNCHVFGWRVGHAGLVVSAKERLTLEARVLGSDSAVLPLAHWQSYPSFAVLRLKEAPKKQRQEIAEYAAANLNALPYRLTAEAEVGEEISGTQCAHLVWYVYKRFGYDLDSDGGRIVTPRDIFDSPLLEIVQIYGMEPEN